MYENPQPQPQSSRFFEVEDRLLRIFEQMLVVGLHYVISHLKAVFLPDTYVVQLTLNCVSCWVIESSKISTAACEIHS